MNTLSNAEKILNELEALRLKVEALESKSKKKAIKTKSESKPLDNKTLDIDGQRLVINIFEDFVKIGNNKRKIYECKKGTYFLFGSHTIYLKYNTEYVLQ